MRRMTGALVLFAVTVLGGGLIPAPAGAITNGTLDDNRHPNVACVMGQLPDGTVIACGSGQLISPTVVLTAGHLITIFQSLGVTRFLVTLDPVFDPATSKVIPAKRVVTDPAFNPVSLSGEDLGVLILSERVKGVVPIQLPTEGLLDQMKMAKALSDQEFIVVGYGVDCPLGPCHPLALDNTRRFASEKFASLDQTKLVLQNNRAATGGGGVCFGDSGSPHFLGDSNVSVGVTSSRPDACDAVAFATRIDTRSARSFLGRFVALP